MKRRITLMLGVMSLLIGLTAPAAQATVAPSTATPAATSCKSTDQFTGTVANMEHYLACNSIPYVVYTMSGSCTTCTVANSTPAITPDSGGPSCQWMSHNVVKFCYAAGGKMSIQCMKYFAGSLYSYNCGPSTAYNLTHAQGLWSYVSSIFTSHAAKACVRGTVAGATTAVILKAAGAATGIGIAASLAGGCVGGIITFFWHI